MGREKEERTEKGQAGKPSCALPEASGQRFKAQASRVPGAAESDTRTELLMASARRPPPPATRAASAR